MNDPEILQTGHGEHKMKSWVPRSFSSLWASLVPPSVPGGGAGIGVTGDFADPDELLRICIRASAWSFVVES